MATASSSVLAADDKREARASTASRTDCGISSPPVASTSVTKNGLPAVWQYSCSASAISRPASVATALNESGKSFSRQTPSARKLAQHNPQRMCAVKLVSVGGDEQRRETLDAPPEQPQNIECRLVGPMNILEHDNRRRPPARLVHQHSRNVGRPRAAVERAGELAACELRDVEQRSERTRREERVAASPQDTGRAAGRFTEPPQQRRLPDARLAADEHEAPARTTPHRPQALLEHRELAAAFQQLARSVHGFRRRSVSHEAPIVAPPPQRDKRALSQVTATPAPTRARPRRPSARRVRVSSPAPLGLAPPEQPRVNARQRAA